MKATVTNKSTSIPKTVPGYVNVAPGTAKQLTGLSTQQAANLLALADNNFEVQLSPDVADNPVWQAVMQAPADPSSGVKVLAGSGFTVETGGSAISSAEPVGLALFDDAACTIPSVGGTIDTATDGTITAGSGSNAVLATVNPANGKLTVSIHVKAAQAVYVKPIANSSCTHFLDCSVVHKTTFS